MENKIDLLSIGDATIDVFMTPTESETLCKIDTKECLIAFSYGDKIPVKNLEFFTGGNAANNAVGVKRLGVSSSIVLTCGDDNVGNQIVEKLKQEGVDLSFVVQQPATSSNYSTVINYQGERTIFVFHAPRSYEFPVALPPAPWVYLTSMGESFQPFFNHLIEWLKKNPQVKLAFNPGTWQFRVGQDTVREILKLTHIVYVNREEAKKLTGIAGGENNIKELLSGLNTLGPKVSIITDGGNGSYLFDARLPAGQGTKFLKCGILPVDAYERTGAGDAFGSGTLAAIIKGRPFEEALIWGTVNSASVIGYTGPQKGLLKESEMPEWLERARSSGVKVEEF